MLISLDEIKTHLRVDCVDVESTDEIKRMYNAAIEYVCNFTDSELEELKDSEGDLKPSVAQAVLLLVGDFYANREAVNEKPLLHSTQTTVERLLHFHRKRLGV